MNALFIEPAGSASEDPVIDALTKRAAHALLNSRPGRGWRGSHSCVCGARSTTTDHTFTGPCGEITTHALMVHYLAHHRDEIPESELVALDALLPKDEAEPSPRMLRGWRFGERIVDEPWMYPR